MESANDIRIRIKIPKQGVSVEESLYLLSFYSQRIKMEDYPFENLYPNCKMCLEEINYIFNNPKATESEKQQVEGYAQEIVYYSLDHINKAMDDDLDPFSKFPSISTVREAKKILKLFYLYPCHKELIRRCLSVEFTVHAFDTRDGQNDLLSILNSAQIRNPKIFNYVSILVIVALLIGASLFLNWITK